VPAIENRGDFPPKASKLISKLVEKTIDLYYNSWYNRVRDFNGLGAVGISL
jgi:hypothetical protein